MMKLKAETAMNFIGLLLIAALSGGIVAVSLRLRASASSDGLRFEGEVLPDEDWRQSVQSARLRNGNWLQDPFGLKHEPGIYRVVKDQTPRLIAK